MSIPQLIKQIRALPFAEMMVIAEELRARIGDLTGNQIEAFVLADILARLQANNLALSEQTVQEEKILRQIFSRKRSIAVDRLDKGWGIDISSLPYGAVQGPALRELFPQLLDQAITAHIMTSK